MSKRTPAPGTTPRGSQRTPPPVAPMRHTSTPAFVEPEPPAPVRKTEPVKVRAKEMGYYDHARRRAGDVFILAHPRDFSEKWMEWVDGRTPEKVTTAKQALEQQHDEIMSGRAPGPSSGDGVL